jgi:IclR family transcriptional regulator, pca regulon regulatory protein
LTIGELSIRSICSPIERMVKLCHESDRQQAFFGGTSRTRPRFMPKLKRDEREDRATDHVESLDRGLRLLQMFGATSSPMTLSDLARAADLPRATARRILFTLERGGFVASDGKLFTLTPHVLTLAASYLRSNQVVAVLQPVLDRVATAAQEISSLAVLDGDEVVFIARGSPARVFSAGLDIGYRLPVFCTSVGRAMLGQFDDSELTAKLAKMRRQPITPHTVTDPELLLAAIITDREKGYSLVDREAEAHFRSISVPVRRYDDTIVAAINMGAHVDRVSAGELIDRFLPLLRRGAEDARSQLL